MTPSEASIGEPEVPAEGKGSSHTVPGGKYTTKSNAIALVPVTRREIQAF